jgi:DegV family protein with EDD domain
LSIAIVTDSTSDILPARAERLGISIVPLFVVFGDRSYRDNVDLSRAEFYRRLSAEATLPTTSQPSAAMFEDAFRPLVEAGREILCLTISSHLSGTINAARAAAASFPDARIEVYDSMSACGGLGMMAMAARDAAERGATMEELLSSLDAERASQHLSLVLPDLAHLQRTGRIGRARAVLGSLMKIVPVLSLEDGQVVARSQVRTFSRAQETMLDLSLDAIRDPAKARFLVMHTNKPELAQTALGKLRTRLGSIEPLLLEIWEAGPVIGAHVGPGAVGIFVAEA